MLLSDATDATIECLKKLKLNNLEFHSPRRSIHGLSSFVVVLPDFTFGLKLLQWQGGEAVRHRYP